MYNEKNIFIQDVGKVILKLDKVLLEKDISVSKLAKEARIQFNQAKSYSEGDMQQVNLVILAKICHTLGCTINDLLEYIPPEEV